MVLLPMLYAPSGEQGDIVGRAIGRGRLDHLYPCETLPKIAGLCSPNGAKPVSYPDSSGFSVSQELEHGYETVTPKLCNRQQQPLSVSYSNFNFLCRSSNYAPFVCFQFSEVYKMLY